ALLVETLHGYTRLCELITTARRAASKGTYRLTRQEVERVLGAGDSEVGGLFALWLPARVPDEAQGRWLQQVFGARAHLAVELHREQDDTARLQQLLDLSSRLSMQAIASGDVHMDVRRQRALQDTMTSIRHSLPLSECGE